MWRLCALGTAQRDGTSRHQAQVRQVLRSAGPRHGVRHPAEPRPAAAAHPPERDPNSPTAQSGFDDRAQAAADRNDPDDNYDD
ncbi:hypothetical protein JOF53_006470 [Crossiella equi]|uniref:Uncharacterized protein n=1 Tax=Crossiella equi TaxID=130796 RepID=A0ABS5AM09_9PSEU|nr:hypothetical protein [Crossiella equi]MBP2477598.1 hypothetical protein [Crossiella equi]